MATPAVLAAVARVVTIAAVMLESTSLIFSYIVAIIRKDELEVF